MKYTNTELWTMAEVGKIFEGDMFDDQEGNTIIFTGKSFQDYNAEDNLLTVDKYIGMCVGDLWTYAGYDMERFETDYKSEFPRTPAEATTAIRRKLKKYKER